MQVDDYLASITERTTELTRRLDAAVIGRSPEDLLRQPSAGVWSPAQVVEHLVITNRSYVPVMRAAIDLAPRDYGGSEAKLSFIGRTIAKMAGPGGNAPAPKFLFPTNRPDVDAVLVEWREQHAQILEIAVAAKGVDLSVVKIRNPFVKWVRLNLVDCFEIMTVHTDRHVGQIEDRVAVRDMP